MPLAFGVGPDDLADDPDLREDVPVPDGGPFECGQRADLHGVPRGTADQTGYALMVRERPAMQDVFPDGNGVVWAQHAPEGLESGCGKGGGGSRCVHGSLLIAGDFLK